MILLNNFLRAGFPLRENDDCMDAGGRATQEPLPTIPLLMQRIMYTVPGKMMHKLLVILLMLSTTFCVADAANYTSLESYLSTLKEFSVSDLSKNIIDINGDNQPDIIGLLKNGEKAKIFILMKLPDGSYELSGESKMFAFETNFNGWLNPPEKIRNNRFAITMVIHSGNSSLKECKYIFTKESSGWRFETNTNVGSKGKNVLENFTFDVPCEFSEVDL